MKILQKAFLLLILSFTVTSCRWLTDGATSPFLGGLRPKVPQGTPTFQKGFRDGCAQILYTRGNYFYKMIFTYHYDPAFNYNKEYRFGYKRGGSACFHHIVGGNALTAPDKFLFPKDVAITAQDYNNATDGMFGGLGAPAPVGNVNGIFEMWSQGSGGAVFGANPLWAGGSKGQFFGQ